MFATFSNWLHWGVERESSITLRRKILHTNLGAFLAILSLFGYAAIFLLIGNDALIKVVYTQIPFYFILAMVPSLNRKGWVNLARWDLAASAILTQLWVIAYLGSYLNSHYYFILFAIVPIVFFPLSQWAAIVFLFVLNLSFYITFEFNWFEPAPAMMEMDTNLVVYLRQLFPTTVFLSMLFFIWMVEIIASRSEAKLEQLSITDALTELHNRRYFESVFAQELAKARRDGSSLMLAILDIDHFKHFNDTYGHDVGDKVLMHFARQFQQATRAGNLIARVGGEEFAVLMPDTTPNEAKNVAERIRLLIQNSPLLHHDMVLPISVSIGVAKVQSEFPSGHSYHLADEALYQAKQSGRNCVVLHKEI